MEKDEDYRIEKIGTPAGDAASANSVVKAINYILLKLKELDDYYTDKLKFLDISSLDPILEDIHNQINELKTNQELINQKLSKIVIEDEKTASESIEPKFALNSEESDILESHEVEKSPQNMELSDLQGLKFKEILSTLTELQTKKDLEIQNQLSKFYSILHDEDISGSLESLGGYIDQKNTLGVIFNFLTLPDSEIPKNYNVMLYGPEGNGKTSLIYALAKKYGYSLIIPDFSILSTYSVDKRSREIISMFKNIRENHEIKPSILFLDNFDLITGPQSSKHILKVLMHEIEKVNLADDRILIIAATQNLEDIEEFILKIFDDFIEFSNPNELEKSKILQNLFENLKFEENLDSDNLINDLAFNNGTKDFSCSDLESLIKIANFQALKEHREFITKVDLNQALKKIKDRKMLIKKIKSKESPKIYEKIEKLKLIEDEITNLKNVTSASQGIIKHSLRLALSENFDFVHRLFNLFKAKNEPFGIDEASKNLGLSVEEAKKILNKDPFKIIFPKIKNSYHLSFDQKIFDEISMEVGFALRGE